MQDQFSRTRLLLGAEAMEKLARARVAVFGLGGVGSWAAEALARSGVGQLDLIDHDRVCLTNLNRQLIATHDTLGQYKVDAAEERILRINPRAVVRRHRLFFTPATADQLDFTQFDYVVDAIDTVTGKLELVLRCRAAGTPIISSMGTGNKLDPTALEVGDVFETSVCPLARIMRKELKKRGVERLKVVWSREPPIPCPEPDAAEEDEAPAEEAAGELCPTGPEPPARRRATPGSTAFVPPAAGLIIAAEIVRELIKARE